VIFLFKRNTFYHSDPKEKTKAAILKIPATKNQERGNEINKTK